MPHKTGPLPPAKTFEQLAGDEIRRLRKEQDWTQEQLGRRMSVYGYDWDQTAVSRIEAGRRPLRLNEVMHLAALFRVPATQFLLPIDVTLPQIDEVIEQETKECDELRERAARYHGTVAAIDAQADKFRAMYKQLADELERTSSHLEIMRGLREVITSGQDPEAGG